jgi:hypothetical protein
LFCSHCACSNDIRVVRIDRLPATVRCCGMAKRAREDPTLPPEGKHLQDSWAAQSAPIERPKRPTKSGLIVLGVALLFMLVAGGSYYWLNGRGQGPIASVAAPPLYAFATATSVAAEAPASRPAGQLLVRLRPLSVPYSDQPVAGSLAPAPRQPPTYEAGLRSPAPAVETPSLVGPLSAVAQ